MSLIEGAPQLPIFTGPTKLADALAKAQAEMKNVTKEREADIKSDRGSYKYKYATLADGIDVVRAALSKHGLAFTQQTKASGDALILYTRLLHPSGEWIESEWPVGSFAKLSPQQMGSALTYARRYSLFSLVGIAGQDDDDDGNAASNAARSSVPPPPPPPPPKAKTMPFDWNECRKWFNGAESEYDLNTRYEKTIKAYPNADRNELDNMVRDAAKKFWSQEEDA
jgi:hypothetical protein